MAVCRTVGDRCVQVSDCGFDMNANAIFPSSKLAGFLGLSVKHSTETQQASSINRLKNRKTSISFVCDITGMT